MESLNQYLERLNLCIERNRYSENYDKETIQFLEDLRSKMRPIQYHTCDDPECIVCG